MAYSVSRRTHELGIRIALGAGRGHVLRLVLRQGALLLAGGLAMGLAARYLPARRHGSVLSLFGLLPWFCGET